MKEFEILRSCFTDQINNIHISLPFFLWLQAGVASDGKLNGIDVNLYADCGSTPNAIDVGTAQSWVDNG